MGGGDWAWGYKGRPHIATVSCKPNGPDGYLSECPYGAVGDTLWVREAFLPCTSVGNNASIADASYVCFRDGSQVFRSNARYFPTHVDSAEPTWPSACKFRPSIHMPRWASRLTLTITEVRIERLADLSDDDARAEGFEGADGFADKWVELHGQASLDSNPWVWVLGFSVTERGVRGVS